MRALAKTPDDVRLVFVGDGPKRRRIQRMAHKLGVAHRIELLGAVPRSDVLGLLASCKAAVFTGLREEGGLALAEAMYLGVPVIVLARGGAATIAESSTDSDRVALVQPGSGNETIQRLAEAMTRFTRHPPAGQGPLLDRERALDELEALFASAQTGRI